MTYLFYDKDKIVHVSDNNTTPPLMNVDRVEETDRNIVMVDGQYLFEDEIPQPTIEEQNEEIRKAREARYVAETDEMQRDWQEAVASGADNAQQLGQEWVAAKNAIRAELPYVVEKTDEAEQGKENATVEETIEETETHAVVETETVTDQEQPEAVEEQSEVENVD